MNDVNPHSFDVTDEFARGIFEALAEGVLVADHHGRVIALNPSAERVLGFTSTALMGKNVHDSPWIMEDEEQVLLEADQWPITITLQTGEPSGRLMVTVRPDGRRRVIIMIAMPLPRPMTAPWTVVSFVDVTPQRTAELALASSEQRFRQLVEQAPDPVIVIDSNGAISACNQRTADVFGYLSSEIIGQPIELLVPDSHRGTHAQLRADYLTTAEARSMGSGSQLSGRRKDGSTFPIEVSLGPLETADGPQVIAIARDLTERQLAHEIAQVEQAKSEFLSRMSHELRTPLNSILGFAQLMQLGGARADQVEALEQIQQAGHHLLDLLNDLLEFERVRSGHITFSTETVSVEETILEAMRLVAPSAQQLGITTETVFSQDAGWVKCDRQRLRQVLLNLLSNAIKYNRFGGHVVIATSATSDEITISTIDTGKGISPENIDRLFVPFERLGVEASGSVEGTGVGLALSKSLVEGMRGRIEVESVEGVGSTFRIALPIADRPELHNNPSMRTQATPFGDELRGVKVLCIEDNEANVRLIEAMLKQFNVGSSMTALTARAGLDLAFDRCPDVILLDLHLPDLHGEVVVEQLRSSQRTRDIPIIVVTADASPATARKLFAVGVERYITKPIDVAALFDAIVAVTR